ncbi:EamA-like transporter family protein [uncultured archaeon]|nr:EamA-like transporter family protein [uncultured archaeon]
MADLGSGIVFGLLSMLGYGLANALYQPLVRQIEIFKTVFFRNLVICAILLGVLFFRPPAPFSASLLLIASMVSVLSYIPLLAYCKAVKAGQVGVVAPVSSSSVLFTVLFSILFFGESFSGGQLFALLLIILGVLALSFDLKHWRASGPSMMAGVAPALVAGVLWGAVFFLLKIPVSLFGPILSALMLEGGVLAASALHWGWTKAPLSLPPKKLLPSLLFIGLLGALGTLAFNFGVEIAPVSIVAALSFSSPLVAAIYAKFAYKEKLGAWQWGALGLVLLGIVLLQFPA